MVDDMRKQMRRFEDLIGFKGKLDVTSGNSMKELIDALNIKYKKDVQSSLRLHRLEFFRDLVERRSRGRREVEAGLHPEEAEERSRTEEVINVEAKDVDDWKDLMTLSKIYYVLEHPRSEGLTWKRRVSKKKKIVQFGDRDLIEWRVTQNFRLRGLEEWAQSRSDARMMAEQCGYELEDGEDTELEELFQLFDPSKPNIPSKRSGNDRPTGPKTSSTERPFKFQDETMEDWTESYSDDSEFSGAEEYGEEIEDFPDESELKLGEFEIKEKAPFDEESIAEILWNYQEYSQYRNPIFEKMDKDQSTQEWFELYKESCIDTYKEEEPMKPKLDEAEDKFDNMPDEDIKLETITEDEELETEQEIITESQVPENLTAGQFSIRVEEETGEVFEIPEEIGVESLEIELEEKGVISEAKEERLSATKDSSPGQGTNKILKDAEDIPETSNEETSEKENIKVVEENDHASDDTAK